MKLFVTTIFTGFTAFCIAQKNDGCLEFVSETNETVLLTPMGDSLWIEYPSYKVKAILYLDEEATEVEGSPFYAGTHSGLEMTVQFLEITECAIDSEADELSLGICKLKEEKPSMKTDFSLGNGSGAPHVRKMIQKPNTDEILSNEDCMIVLKVRIDQDGNVAGFPSADRSQTTTTDSELIRKVSEIVRKETKYAKAPGKAMESMTIQIRLKAN